MNEVEQDWTFADQLPISYDPSLLSLLRLTSLLSILAEAVVLV
jgi:hypothetical protein